MNAPPETTVSKHKPTFVLAVCFAAVLVAAPFVVRADPQSEFSDRERELAEKAAQVRSLSEEVELLDETVEARSKYLAELTIDLNRVRDDLTVINRELSEMQEKRLAAETVLNRFIRSDYTAARVDAYTILASERSLSENLANQSYVGNLQGFMDKMAERLAKLERDMASRQKEARSRYAQLDGAEQRVSREAAELATIRDHKSALLAETQGQEDFYRRQYEASREQLKKMGIFARSARQRIASRVWDDAGGYYNQLDSRWIDDKLGFSRESTLGDYGCGVAALATVFRHYGIDTDPPRLNQELRRNRAFVDDLLDWRRVPAASGGLLTLASKPYPIGQPSVDWALIDAQLAANNPVIVYVDRAGEISHYVTLIAKRGENYFMHDPIEGPNLRFGDYYRNEAVLQAISFRPA